MTWTEKYGVHTAILGKGVFLFQVAYKQGKFEVKLNYGQRKLRKQYDEVSKAKEAAEQWAQAIVKELMEEVMIPCMDCQTLTASHICPRCIEERKLAR